MINKLILTAFIIGLFAITACNKVNIIRAYSCDCTDTGKLRTLNYFNRNNPDYDKSDTIKRICQDTTVAVTGRSQNLIDDFDLCHRIYNSEFQWLQ